MDKSKLIKNINKKIIIMKKELTKEETDQIVKEFNEAVKNGEITAVTDDKADEFCEACDNYYSRLRYREYSRNDMIPQTFHKNLCTDDSAS